jgi:hypothetical protein
MKWLRLLAARILRNNVKGYCMQQDMDSGWIYGDGWHIEFKR